MNEVKQQLEELGNGILKNIYGSWKDKLVLMNKGIEVLSYINNSNATDHELYVAKYLGKELLLLGILEPVKDKSVIRRKLYLSTELVKKELAKMKDVNETKEINNIDDWIKSLDLFRPLDSFVSSKTYQKSYDLFMDIRKVLLDSKLPNYRRIYTKKLTDIITEESTKSIRNLQLLESDKDLLQVVQMVKNNPSFDYKSVPFGIELNEKCERCIKRKRLEKQLLSLK